MSFDNLMINFLKNHQLFITVIKRLSLEISVLESCLNYVKLGRSFETSLLFPYPNPFHF